MNARGRHGAKARGGWLARSSHLEMGARGARGAVRGTASVSCFLSRARAWAEAIILARKREGGRRAGGAPIWVITMQVGQDGDFRQRRRGGAPPEGGARGRRRPRKWRQCNLLERVACAETGRGQVGSYRGRASQRGGQCEVPRRRVAWRWGEKRPGDGRGAGAHAQKFVCGIRGWDDGASGPTRAAEEGKRRPASRRE
jgi:hypothetical protein